MNKLSDEHLYLLLDEPIYVLEEHFESHEITKVPDVKTVKSNEASVLIMGENQKGILILVDEKNDEVISEEDKNFLFKGLNALKIFVEDVAIAKMNDQNEISESINFSVCIRFSDDLEKVFYQPETEEGVTRLNCHSLAKIRSEQDLKLKFWRSLQALFTR